MNITRLPYVAWEYEGAFSIVFNEKDQTIAKEMILVGLKECGFSIHSIRRPKDIASCAHVKIQGIENHPAYRGNGAWVEAFKTFFSYTFIEGIVSADGKVLWTR